MRIITISREFGSGGRELGKRLAGLLGIDYYDREIITAIAEQNGLDEGYVEMALEKRDWQAMPLTFGRSFAGINGNSLEAVDGGMAVPIISPSIRRVGIWKNWFRRWKDLSSAGMGGKSEK